MIPLSRIREKIKLPSKTLQTCYVDTGTVYFLFLRWTILMLPGPLDTSWPKLLTAPRQEDTDRKTPLKRRRWRSLLLDERRSMVSRALSRSVDGARFRASNDLSFVIRAYFTAGATYFVKFSTRKSERASEPYLMAGSPGRYVCRARNIQLKRD